VHHPFNVLNHDFLMIHLILIGFFTTTVERSSVRSCDSFGSSVILSDFCFCCGCGCDYDYDYAGSAGVGFKQGEVTSPFTVGSRILLRSTQFPSYLLPIVAAAIVITIPVVVANPFD